MKCTAFHLYNRMSYCYMKHGSNCLMTAISSLEHGEPYSVNTTALLLTSNGLQASQTRRFLCSSSTLASQQLTCITNHLPKLMYPPRCNRGAASHYPMEPLLKLSQISSVIIKQPFHSRRLR